MGGDFLLIQLRRLGMLSWVLPRSTGVGFDVLRAHLYWL